MTVTNMTRVTISDVLDISANDLWAVLRDFNALPQYHPFFATSEIENGWPSDRIGCVRNFTGTEPGVTVRERLLALDDAQMRCRYEIIGLNEDFVFYISEVRLWRVTQTGQCFGQWWAEFDMGDAGRNAAFAERVADTFRLGLRGAADVALSRKAG